MAIDQPCIDAYLPGERWDPVALPMISDPQNHSSDELALARHKTWQAGQELRIRFLDGDARTRALVEDIARTWLEHANLYFTFGDRVTTELRITFTGAGYWSYVGTDARQISQDMPTMRLGTLSALTDAADMRRVVLHEFGHAIGCIHEQSSPVANIPWNKPVVYSYYGRIGWDRAMVDHNIFRRYSTQESLFSAFDPHSIMQYPVPKDHAFGGLEIGWNKELSTCDKAFVSVLYPPDPSTPPR